MTDDRGLVDLGLADLELLEQAASSGRIARLDTSSLQTLALGHLAGKLGPLDDLEVASALPALRAVLAERRYRLPPHLELVWTGPEAGLRPARDTAVILRQLFGLAERRVLVGGYSFDHGEDILLPLHRSMVERGVEVTLFLDIPRTPAGEVPKAHADAYLNRFFSQNWPFGPPRPHLFYDPRTISPTSIISLHAKCVVIDDRWALISSANFTQRGLHRNLEVGVLIDDPTFASRLYEQWVGLIESGQMLPYLP